MKISNYCLQKLFLILLISEKMTHSCTFKLCQKCAIREPIFASNVTFWYFIWNRAFSFYLLYECKVTLIQCWILPTSQSRQRQNDHSKWAVHELTIENELSVKLASVGFHVSMAFIFIMYLYTYIMYILMSDAMYTPLYIRVNFDFIV